MKSRNKKNKKDILDVRTSAFKNHALAFDYLQTLKLKNLKREVVARGMPFEDVASGNIPQLQGYFSNHYNEPVVKEKIYEYDAWLDAYMIGRGRDAIHPMLKLGVVVKTDESTGEQYIIEQKKMKGFKEAKKKVEKNEFGVRLGTAKAYVGYLVKRNFTIEQTIRRTQARFEKGSEGSIRIWYKKFKTALNDSV